MKWTKRESTCWNYEKELNLPVADQYEVSTTYPSDKPPLSNSIEIEAHFHHNGSGPKAFGGAKCWPVISMHVGFPEGQLVKRDKFAKALQDFLNDYFNK